MNHVEYQKACKHKTPAELRYIIANASEAARVNPSNPNVGYYRDEVHYAAKLRRRGL